MDSIIAHCAIHLLQIGLPHFFVLRRTCALIILVTALGGVWTLEQPSGSVLEYYPTFRWIMANIFTCGGDYAVSCLFGFRIMHIESDRINFERLNHPKKNNFSVRAPIISKSEFKPLIFNVWGCESSMVDATLFSSNSETSLWLQ